MITRILIIQSTIFLVLAMLLFTIPNDFDSAICGRLSNEERNSTTSITGRHCQSWDFKFMFLWLAMISLIIAAVVYFRKSEKKLSEGLDFSS